MTDFTAFRGDDFTFSLTFEDEDDVAVDITGWTIFFTLKHKRSDSDDDAVLQVDSTTHSDPTNGISELSLTDTQTAALKGSYVYDLQYKDDSGLIKTFASGCFTFTEDVTIRTS